MPTDTLQLQAAWQAHDRSVAALAAAPGQVFTPRALALQLAQATLQPLNDPPRLLDPACGCGALLLGAIEWASQHRAHWLEAWSLGGLAGIDSDPACVAACQASIPLALGPHSAANITLGDSLCAPARPQWDVVLANPPWVSFSGRHAAPLAPALRQSLAGRFAAFRGWPSLHAAFCEQIAGQVLPGGRIGLLLPLQMADLAAYGPARDALEARHRLESLADLGESAFAKITEPCGLFVFGPGPASRLPWPACQDDQVLYWARRFRPLPPASFGDVGIHSGNVASHLFSGVAGPGFVPVRQGRDVRAFALAEPALWLRGGPLPPGGYCRVPPPAAFQRARILLRQTADRPIAARHEPVGAFRNSLLACFGTPEHDDDFLLGC